MGSREEILTRLRAAPKPFTDLSKRDTYLHMVPIEDKTSAALRKRFVEEAKKLACEVSEPTSHADAIEQILALFGENKSVIAWDFANIPLAGLADALANAGITIADVRDGSVRVGLTGVDAALASTGSMAVGSGPGKPRQASLLPALHIAVLTPDQIIPDLETWFDGQLAKGLEHFRSAAAHVIISGPSRTADIAMELVMGVHGPTRVHIVILP
ncbi:MAG: lactate utilization protein [Chloroflexi bacterium]|nr:lactate utilization protein [Chloroflexota bacterium]